MRENALKAKWRAGETAHGAWLAIPSSFTAEIIARQGFDYVNIDLQHGIVDYQVAVTMLQAISITDATPTVRVPWNEPGIIMKCLDAGAIGVIIPMVNTVEEAQAAVAACRYYPEGMRSNGPIRAAMYSGRDYFAHANKEVACIPMIETKQAVVADHMKAREAEVSDVRVIVAEETQNFIEWWEQLQVVPTIAALTERADLLRQRELEKSLRRMDLNAEQTEQLNALTRAVVKQILHDPIKTLRERGDRDVYVDAVRTLFHLDDSSSNGTAPAGDA